jgi:predicted amidophosphoribosyltransferase
MSHTYRHPCGCKSKGDEWVSLCAACGAAFDERHRQAAQDQREREAARLPAPAAEARP